MRMQATADFNEMRAREASASQQASAAQNEIQALAQANHDMHKMMQQMGLSVMIWWKNKTAKEEKLDAGSIDDELSAGFDC